MNLSTQMEAEASAETQEPSIPIEEIGPLPFFGYCTEIHTSNAPVNLPEEGEADEHERKLFAAPWEER